MIYKTLLKYGVILAFIMGLCTLSYQLGKSNARVQIVEKQIEVIKYVEQKRSVIQSRPNAGRSELLARMRAGKL